MNQSDSIAELATALSKAQSEIQGAKKDCANPFFKSKYADLASVWDACREPLTKNGLSIIQTTGERDGKQYLYTTLAHSSGQWIKSELQIVVGKPDIQSLGSAITYSRRYSLAMIAGVCPEDDDGNAAAQAPKQQNVVHHEINKKDEPKISHDQASALKKMLSSCPQDFVNSFLASIRAAPVNANTIDQIPASQYDRIAAYLQNKINSEVQ